MRTAIVHGGMAGALWGAVIVAPSLIPEVHPVVISCVRFLLYGLFATLLAVPIARSLISRLTRQDQLLLLELALTGNLVYFILLSAAVQYAGVLYVSLFDYIFSYFFVCLNALQTISLAEFPLLLLTY